MSPERSPEIAATEEVSKRRRRTNASWLGVVLTLTWGLASVAAEELNIGPNAVRLFPHPNYVGVSADYFLPVGEDFLLVPQLPKSIDDQVSSIAMGEEVGVILFRDPGFAGKDDGLATPTDQECSDIVHQYTISMEAFQGSQPVVEFKAGTNYHDVRDLFDSPKTARGLGDAASSMVIFRRSVGGMHGAQLLNFGRDLELAHLFEGGRCDFTRQFFPLASLDRGQCFPIRDWDTQWLILHGGSVRVDLFDGPDCTGERLKFPDPMLERTTFDLVAHGWENRTRSLFVFVVDLKAPKIAGAEVWQPEPPQWVERDRSRIGQEVDSMWLADNDAVACQKACSAEGYCRSYTFTPFARGAGVVSSTGGPQEQTRVHHCVLNRDVPQMTRETSAVSGVKSYAGATTLRFEKPTLNGQPISACIAPNACDQQAGQAYCRAQGLARVESATWAGRGLFDQIICTNVTRVEGSQAEGSAPAQVAIPSQKEVVVGLARCEAYAKKAVEQNQENVALGCGWGEPVWSDDDRRHYEWCVGVPADASDNGTKQRELMLAACRNTKDRPTQCDAYAKSAIQDQKDNVAQGCGKQGPEWSTDYHWHYDWCPQVDAAQSEAGSVLRKKALAECSG